MIRKQLISIYVGIGKLRDTIVSLFTIFLFSSFWSAYGINKQKKTQRNRCFVLGNGPSLDDVLRNKLYCQELLESDCVVTNRFANTEYYKMIKPRYYILLDPVFSDEKTISNDKTIKSIYENFHLTDWKMILFVKKSDNIRIIKRMINNPNITVVNFNATKIVGYSWFQNICYKYNLGIPSSRNVIISALQLMINLGYKNIYLYGAEFSWTKTIDVDPRNNKVFLNNKHFYANKEILYQEKGWYRSYLIFVAEMLDGLYQVEKYAKYSDVLIKNRSKGSFIDAFEYENPDNISE